MASVADILAFLQAFHCEEGNVTTHFTGRDQHYFYLSDEHKADLYRLMNQCDELGSLYLDELIHDVIPLSFAVDIPDPRDIDRVVFMITQVVRRCVLKPHTVVSQSNAAPERQSSYDVISADDRRLLSIVVPERGDHPVLYEIRFPRLPVQYTQIEKCIHPKLRKVFERVPVTRVFAQYADPLSAEQSAAIVSLRAAPERQQNAAFRPMPFTSRYPLDATRAILYCPVVNDHQDMVQLQKKQPQRLHSALLSMQVDRDSMYMPVMLRTKVLPSLRRPHLRTRHSQCYSAETLEVAVDLLVMVRDERVCNSNECNEIGCVLYNITHGHEAGRAAWIAFCTREINIDEPPAYSRAKCERRWPYLDGVNPLLGLATLRSYVREDAQEPLGVENEGRALDRIADLILKCADYDVAQIFRILFPHQFVFCDKMWYRFCEHRWQVSHHDLYVRKLLVQRVRPLVDKYAHQIVDRRIHETCDTIASLERDGNDTSQQTAELHLDRKRAKKARQLSFFLGKTSFLNGVVRAIGIDMTDDSFAQRLDPNPHLYCFSNGVLNTMNGHVRAGTPDDMCFRSCKRDYILFDDDDPAVLAMHRIIDQWFPDPELARYFKLYCASCLFGRNDEKKLMIFTGIGHNAKSAFVNFLKKAFGEYACTMPTSFLIGPRTQTSQASPEMARTHGRRVVFFHEPSEKEILNTALIKNVTGNDEFFTRALYQEGNDMVIQWKMALLANRLPRVETTQEIDWDRFRILPCLSRFVDADKAPTDPAEQIRLRLFPKNERFEETLDELVEPFLYILVQTYLRIYRFEKMGVEPYQVKMAHQRYQRENDIVREFFEESLEYNASAVLRASQAWALFRKFYEFATGGRTGMPDRHSFTRAFSHIIGGEPDQHGCWRGFQMACS